MYMYTYIYICVCVRVGPQKIKGLFCVGSARAVQKNGLKFGHPPNRSVCVCAMVFKCKCAGVYLCINIERYVNIQICYNSLMRKGYVNLCLSVFAFVQWGRLIQQFYSSLVLRRPGPRPKTTKKRLNGHRFRELESTATYPSF